MTQPLPLFRQMSVLGDPLRSRLLLALDRSELTVGEVCGIVQSPQSTVSRHLKALSDAGWVASRPDGTSRRYAIAGGSLEPPVRALWHLVRKETAATLAAQQDERRLAQIVAARRSRSEEFFRSGAARWDSIRDEMFGHQFLPVALLGLVDGGSVVADLGCGTGATVEAVAPFVREVIGVDSSASMLEAARKRLAGFANVELRSGTLEKLPVEDAALDAATMILVLHHVAEPARALAEVARALKPGGRLVVVDMVPHDREEYRAQMGHIWLGFSGPDVERLLTDAGFYGVQVRPLPSHPKAKGPDLFAARALSR